MTPPAFCLISKRLHVSRTTAHALASQAAACQDAA